MFLFGKKRKDWRLRGVSWVLVFVVRCHSRPFTSIHIHSHPFTVPLVFAPHLFSPPSTVCLLTPSLRISVLPSFESAVRGRPLLLGLAALVLQLRAFSIHSTILNHICCPRSRILRSISHTEEAFSTNHYWQRSSPAIARNGMYASAHSLPDSVVSRVSAAPLE